MRWRRYGQPLLHGGLRALAQQCAAGGDFRRHVAGFHPAQHGRLQTAEAEIERVAFHFGEGEAHRRGSPWGARRSMTGPPGIAEAQQLGDFVESFAGGVVAGLAEQAVAEALRGLRTGGCGRRSPPARARGTPPAFRRAGFQNHRVDVAFDVVDGDERHAARRSTRLWRR